MLFKVVLSSLIFANESELIGFFSLKLINLNGMFTFKNFCLIFQFSRTSTNPVCRLIF